MRLENFNFYCSNNFLLLHLNSDGIEDDNIQSLGHGLCLVKRRKLFTLCKIQSQRQNSAWGAEYPICVRDLIRTTYGTLAQFGDEKKALHGQRSQACNNIQVP